MKKDTDLKANIIFIDSFNGSFEQWAVDDILRNPHNMLWNIARLYRLASEKYSRPSLKQVSRLVARLYNEEDLLNQLEPIYCFSPDLTFCQLSNIVIDPGGVINQFAGLYHRAAQDRTDLMFLARNLYDLARKIGLGSGGGGSAGG